MELKEEKEKVDEVCMRRHRRWSLSLQLDRLHKDTEKVFVHSPDSTPVALPTVVVTCMTIIMVHETNAIWAAYHCQSEMVT